MPVYIRQDLRMSVCVRVADFDKRMALDRAQRAICEHLFRRIKRLNSNVVYGLIPHFNVRARAVPIKTQSGKYRMMNIVEVSVPGFLNVADADAAELSNKLYTGGPRVFVARRFTANGTKPSRPAEDVQGAIDGGS